ncbi:MAG: glycosyltransferase family 4 protein [Bacteroidetes bacterium]|nr:glycosyltransferase family 4 protein [Bacteroidota bacterium]
MKSTLLYIKHANSSFIMNDQHILEKYFDVKPFLIRREHRANHFVLRMFSMAFFILVNSGKSKVIITWFADYHAAICVFFGRLINIKVAIIAGGQEAICYPELKKGVYYKKIRSVFVKYALRHADLIIPNHKSLVLHENFYYDPTGKKDGMKFYIPDLKTPISILENGIDSVKFHRNSSIPKNDKLVLTVGTMTTVYDFINKGFDLFIQLAERNPHLEFKMIGVRKQFLPWIEEKFPFSHIQNLHVIYSFCPDEVLFEAYNRAKVFIQASITEGMPNTLSEAMLCECIPVGSNVNGIPDAIGDTGIIVLRRNVEELEKAVHQALVLNTGEKARKYVLGNFSVEKREDKFIRILKEHNFFE